MKVLFREGISELRFWLPKVTNNGGVIKFVDDIKSRFQADTLYQ